MRKKIFRLCYIYNGEQEIIGFPTLSSLRKYMQTEMPSGATNVRIYSGTAMMWIC